MRPLSEDLRRRIIEARQAGAGSIEVSERFRVTGQTVARLFGQFERTGEWAPKQIGGYRRSRLAPHSRTINRWIIRKADISLMQLKGSVAKQSWASRLGSTLSGTSCGGWD